MGDGRPGGAHPGGPHAGSRPGVGHVHGGAALPHRGGFNHGGHFVHGAHGGVTRIWWVSGGVWYPWYGYSYAYPYAYAAPDYTSVWYYCQSAGAYYPYVSYCPEGWVAVTPYAY